MFGTLPTVYVLKEAMNEIEPGDLRLAKLKPDARQPSTAYASKASLNTYAMYTSSNSFIPIIRNEELNLYEAEIQLGLGNIGAATGAINTVRSRVGGLLPVSPTTYTAIRDYGLPLQADTTWEAADTHATVQPFPVTEVTARNANMQYACP